MNLAEYLRAQKGQLSVGTAWVIHWNRVFGEKSEKAEEIL